MNRIGCTLGALAAPPFGFVAGAIAAVVQQAERIPSKKAAEQQEMFGG